MSVCMWLQVITQVRLCVGRYGCRCDGRFECTCLCGCACIYKCIYIVINPMSKWRMVIEKESILYVLDIPLVSVKIVGIYLNYCSVNYEVSQGKAKWHFTIYATIQVEFLSKLHSLLYYVCLLPLMQHCNISQKCTHKCWISKFLKS